MRARAHLGIVIGADDYRSAPETAQLPSGGPGLRLGKYCSPIIRELEVCDDDDDEQ